METIYEVYLFGNVTITCDFFHDDRNRMELGSHVAHLTCVCFEMLRTALFYCNCYVINSPVS